MSKKYNGEPMYLSWIIPTYKRETRLRQSILEVDAYLRSKNFSGGYEILVVNSSSPDHTIEVVKNLNPQIPNLRILNLENRGKGWAVKQGMLNTSGEIRLFTDDDNSVSPDQLDKFLPFLCAPDTSAAGCFDVVIGSIETAGAVIEENARWYRRWLGRLAKYVIRVGAGLWEIRDSQRGFKVFSKGAAEFIFSRLTIFVWGFDIEVLVIAKSRGFKIKEIPVTWVNPSDSAINLKSYISTLGELLQIRWNKVRGLYKS